MIIIKLTQQINSDVNDVFNTLLAHEKLSRFFNGTFRLVHPSNDTANSNGVGAVREICMRGETFCEEIIAAQDGHIEYRIMGNKPIKNHRGVIDIKPNQQGCLVDYVIECEAQWWQPSFIVKHIITHDITVGLTKLAEHYNERCINSIGD